MALYKDLNLSFEKHPLTGDILTATDTEAIRKSVRNLILLNLREAPFDPEKGTNLRGSLFENFSPMTTSFLRKKIEGMIDEYEPRVMVRSIDIFQRDDYNSLEVTIYYEIVNLNVLDELSLTVERTR